ncbi:Carbohydrate sulfotransferase 11 [Varanus komodoensis]|nr:Carbohydrate sulfotransferase 11 [Varanus komodoensis]
MEKSCFSKIKAQTEFSGSGVEGGNQGSRWPHWPKDCTLSIPDLNPAVMLCVDMENSGSELQLTGGLEQVTSSPIKAILKLFHHYQVVFTLQSVRGPLVNNTTKGFVSAEDLELELSSTAILHQIRRDQVTDTCRANSMSSRKRRVLTPNDLKHLVVDEDHELIYCYVPKVACTNWKRVMMVLTGRGKYSDPMEIPANKAHISSNLKTLNQYSIPEINHRLKNYMKFLFVREPFERLVSAYRNKFTQKYNTSFHKRYGTKIVKRQRKNATQEALHKGDDVKFEEFVAYLIDPHTQREEPFNEHWQTVYSLCHPCHIHYDLIGKYETLEEDSNYVLQLAGVGNYLKFPTYAKSTRTTDEMTTEFFQNISAEHQTQLYEVYKLDFLMFNYSVPSYLKLE